MTDADKAVEIWREIVGIPAGVERVRSGASGEPMTYRVVVPAKNLSGKSIGELLKTADAHKVQVGVGVRAAEPFMVLT